MTWSDKVARDDYRIPLDRRGRWLASVLVGGVMLMLFVLVVAVGLPAGLATRTMLREAYGPRHVTISSLKTENGMGSCGRYAVDGQAWRYLSTGRVLWAEGLSREWQSQSQAAVDLQDRWSYCMMRTDRGHGLDWLSGPVAVVYLNAQ